MSSQAHSHAPGTARSERASTPLVDDEEPWTQEISEPSPQVPSLMWGEPEDTSEPPDTEPPNESANRRGQSC